MLAALFNRSHAVMRNGAGVILFAPLFTQFYHRRLSWASKVMAIWLLLRGGVGLVTQIYQEVIMHKLGKNIEYERKENILTVRIDLSKDFGVSKSGKSIVIASTEGNIAVGELPNGKMAKIGCNVYTSK